MVAIRIAPNKLRTETTEFDFTQKISTLIGENGCGKSSILETIFNSYNEHNNKMLIAYSSGKNERYSILYKQINKEYNKKIRRLYKATNEIESRDREVKMNAFYFDTNRAQLIIFCATILKKEGETRKFLLENNYIEINNDGHDISSSLKLPINIKSNFIKRIYNERQRDVDKPLSFGIIKGDFFKILSKVLTQYNGDYDFETIIKNTEIIINNNNFFNIFFNNPGKIINFFYELCICNKISSLDELVLSFKESLILRDLSDGEFQLLITYAIVDLFDAENTLFLFDEIDSHLYYENINKLRQTLNQIKGKVINTTHIPDSIINNKIESICLVEHGLINQNGGVNSILDRIQNLSNRDFYEKKIASKVENIVLIEDTTDWIVFTELLRIKCGDAAVDNLLNGVYFIKCESGYACHTQVFGDGKKKWIEKFYQVNGENSLTRNIFMICDRDNLPLNSINPNDKVRVVGENGDILKHKRGRKAIVLSWRRKQIENYLLSYAMLHENGKLDEINLLLSAQNQITEGNNLDNWGIQDLEIKDTLTPFYSIEGSGVDYEKLKTIIQQIPANEISEDIENMYNFIIGKIS